MIKYNKKTLLDYLNYKFDDNIKYEITRFVDYGDRLVIDYGDSSMGKGGKMFYGNIINIYKKDMYEYFMQKRNEVLNKLL